MLDGEQATRLLELVPTDLPWAVACLASAHMARRDLASAFPAAEYAVALLDSTGETCVEEAFVLLAHVDALNLAGRVEDARNVVAFAHGRMLARAEHISNPAWRDAWLNAVREHARLTNLVGQIRSAVESTLF